MFTDTLDFLKSIFLMSGYVNLTWKSIVMFVICLVLIYLAIVKKFEPLLLLPIGLGMLIANIPLSGMSAFQENGLMNILYQGVKMGVYPPLIFLGIGAMIDFSPLIANPSSFLMGAAAQAGIFLTFLGATLLGFTPAQAGAISIIGGADGPTTILVSELLAPELLSSVAIAAYSYMALVPLIQPPIMRLLTTKKERRVVMKIPRKVSKIEKIIFPITIMLVVCLLVPASTPLLGSLMIGNIINESGVADRLSKTLQTTLMNIVVVFLGLSIGATATADNFLSIQTIGIIALGLVSFGVSTAFGVICGKIMCFVTKGKVNPLIGSAAVSAMPMAARVSHKVAQEENSSNYLLMHAMGPNVSGVIATAIVAGLMISKLG